MPMTDDIVKHIELPPEVVLREVAPANHDGGNQVFTCIAQRPGRVGACFLKVARAPVIPGRTHPLENEADVLAALSATAVPVPQLVAAASSPLPWVLITALPGVMLWDHIDPRRGGRTGETALPLLARYGAALARIHALPIRRPPQLRHALESLEDFAADPDDTSAAVSQRIVSWLRANTPVHREMTFVHGDFNVANVLLADGQVSAVLDWEFAGNGWREFDIAWALRARTHFLNTSDERGAVLDGYCSLGTFDRATLRWCEVLNYLRFARWDRAAGGGYGPFALERAVGLMDRVHGG